MEGVVVNACFEFGHPPADEDDDAWVMLSYTWEGVSYQIDLSMEEFDSYIRKGVKGHEGLIGYEGEEMEMHFKDKIVKGETPFTLVAKPDAQRRYETHKREEREWYEAKGVPIPPDDMNDPEQLQRFDNRLDELFPD